MAELFAQTSMLFSMGACPLSLFRFPGVAWAQDVPQGQLQVVKQHLPLQYASRLGETCTQLHRALIRNLPGLSTVLALSHTPVTDDQLELLCRRANCKVRALSVAGCENLTPFGLANVIRLQIGPSLLYLDISACSQLLVDAPSSSTSPLSCPTSVSSA